MIKLQDPPEKYMVIRHFSERLLPMKEGAKLREVDKGVFEEDHNQYVRYPRNGGWNSSEEFENSRKKLSDWGGRQEDGSFRVELSEVLGIKSYQIITFDNVD